MRNRRIVRLMLGALSVLVLGGLGLISVANDLSAAPVTDMNQIIGKDWVLTKIGGESMPEEPPVTLTFGIDGELFGSGGCNQYFGSYKFNAGKLTVGPLGATKMMCPPTIMKIEYSFLAALVGTFDLTADDSSLTICPEDKVKCLAFKAK